MNLYERIHRKRLKRKRMLAGRLECHGTKNSCYRVHLKRKTVPEFVMPLRSELPRQRWWYRFINWLTNLWK